MSPHPQVFFLAIGARDRASSRLRVWDHVDWLRDQGFDVTAESVLLPAREHTRWRALARLVRRLPGWLAAFARADAVFVQETLILAPFLWLRPSKKQRLVFDFSDPVDRAGTGLRGAVRRWAFARMVAGADAVVVENRGYMAKLAGKARRIEHQYGPVDARRYAPSQDHSAGGDDRPLTVGWTGSPGTFGFIEPIFPALAGLHRTRPIELVLIGAPAQVPECPFPVSCITWDVDTEFAQLPTFDIGLFRLPPGPDGLWRGAGKLFIYIASGVHFVASDAGIAKDVMAETGFGSAVADDGWDTPLAEAYDSVRAQAGRKPPAYRDYAAAHLSYEAYRARLVSVLKPTEDAR